MRPSLADLVRRFGVSLLRFVRRLGASLLCALLGTQMRFRPAFDPFNCTHGRWLHRDQEQRDARKLQFDFDALLNVAIKCSPGAQRVTHCEKKEGGFNRVFMIHLDNGSTVVARLPTRIAGPPGLTVSSEVATLQFVKERTTVPVPSVLAWSAESQNTVGAEYMILEAMPGVNLRHVWNGMPAWQHVRFIRNLGNLLCQVCRHDFPAYGSLYLNNKAPSGVVKLDETYCIGPICAPQHCNCGIDGVAGLKQPNHYQGPWHNTDDYFSDLIARARLSLHAKMEEAEMPHNELLDMLQQTLSILTATEDVETASGLILYHPDLHARNIFVDPEDHTKITGIIDWQSAAIEPAFVFAAKTPDFAARLPDQEGLENLTAEVQAANARVRLDVEYCVATWWVMQQACEKLGPACRLNHNLHPILAAPSVGWIDQKTTIEQLLNDLAKEWEQLGLPGQSVYKHWTPEDISQDLDESLATGRLKAYLARILRCDTEGRVPSEWWEGILPLYRSEYERYVESVVETEECTNDEEKARAVEKANRLWPFDQR